MKFDKLIPELMVGDLAKSLNFYRNILGFKIEYEREENKFAFLSFQGSQLMIQEDNKVWKTGELVYPLGRGINFQIEVKDTNKIIDSLKKNNYPLFRELKECRYRVNNKIVKCKEFLVQDPDGYLFRFSEI